MDTAIILFIIDVPTLLLAVIVIRLLTQGRRSGDRTAGLSMSPNSRRACDPPEVPYTPMTDEEFAKERRKLLESGGAVRRTVMDREDLDQVRRELLLIGVVGGYLTPSKTTANASCSRKPGARNSRQNHS